MLPRLVPLLERRAAELPRYRVRAQLPHTPGFGAELEREPLAWQTNRAGDTPYHFTPAPVPAEDRYPYAAYDIPVADAAAVARMRAIAEHIRNAGMVSTDTEGELLDQLDTTLAAPNASGAERAAGILAELLTTLDADEHGIGNADATGLEESLRELTDYGIRAPLESIEHYYQPDDAGELN